MSSSAVRAEQIKFFSTKGWAVGLVCLLLFGMILPIGNAVTANSTAQTVTNVAGLGGVADFGLMVLMVVAALSVTQEYRFGTVQTSLLALPARSQWLIAKGVFMSLVAAAASVILAGLGILAVSLIADPTHREGVGLLAAAPLLGRVALVTVAMVLLALGVAALVRNTATAVALIVLWPTVAELLLAKLPGLAEHTPPFLLWANVAYAMTGRDAGVDFHWGPAGAILYLAGVGLVVFAAGILVTRRRAVRE